jgi:ubiquinone biosynthesis protein
MTARQRKREIAAVLLRHGLKELAIFTGLHRAAALGRSAVGLPTEPDRDPAPRELRLALEELGPTFIKLGQLASTRPDLLPPQYLVELAKLQDADPAVPAQAAWAAIEAELGDSTNTAFRFFGLEPLAAASIGQAHPAVLQDGTDVVVKVRRPGAVEQIELDLEIVQECAEHASRRWEAAARLDLVGLAREFARLLRAELDYRKEGKNAERFAANFADDADVQIPRVFWETTTSQVITLERIRGMKITDVEGLVTARIDRHELAERATRMTAKMVFDDGFFHGDLHPGNFFVESSGRIGLIDFGIVGTLDDGVRDELGGLLIAIFRKDPQRLAASLIALGGTTGPIDRGRLGEDLAEWLTRYSQDGLGDISIGAAVGEVMGIARLHRLRLPPSLALLAKIIVMGEGLAAELDPGFQLGEALAPYARRQVIAQLTPAALGRRLERAGVDLAELAVDFPEQLHRLLEVLGGGGFELHLRTGELEPLLQRAERLGNRIAASVLVAAGVNALTELAVTGHIRRSGWRRPLPVVAAALGLYVVGKRELSRTARRTTFTPPDRATP